MKFLKAISNYLLKTPTMTQLEDFHAVVLITPAVISSLCYGAYYYKSVRNGNLTLGEPPLCFEWRKDGLLHREDGAAKINFLHITKDYYFNGKLIEANDTVEFKRKIKMKAFW